MKIYDPYGRPIENLRLIVTTVCNYNCIFCHSEGYYPCAKFNFGLGKQKTKKAYLTPSDVRLIASVARMFEIESVKITGGEPLIHPQIEEIIKTLKELGFKDISLVTNGYYLTEKAEQIKMAGLNRINVSLPSLNPERYKKITRVANLDRVLKGIRAAIRVGLTPLKINVVLLAGINTDEIEKFINFARNIGAILQFIEYHAPPGSPGLKQFYYPLKDLEERISNIAKSVKIRRMHARKVYTLDDGLKIEIVRPMYNPEFCANCIRIRATPTGWKPCLLRDIEVNYEEALEKGDLRALTYLFLEAIKLRRPFFT